LGLLALGCAGVSGMVGTSIAPVTQPPPPAEAGGGG